MPSSDESTAAPSELRFPSRAFALYQGSRALIVLATEMQSVAVGWQVYEITKRPLDLGLVGLAQFLPGVVLFLAAGHAADHFDRRNLLVWCNAGFAICASLLLKITSGSSTSIYPIYVVLVLIGVFRTFSGPASQALLPQLVSERDFSKAVAWGASMRQGANILGPSLGGVLYAVGHGAWIVYIASAIVSAAAMLAMLGVPRQQRAWPRTRVRISTVFAGLRYIWRQKLILGTISLDLFAVLLGGAVALLPVYAREILNTGPWGLGILRSAPGVGSGIAALALAYRPLRRRAGPIMLGCVAGFGVFTIVFGLSHNLALSVVSLVFVGASDMVSVIIRTTLIQLGTADEMRGRVSAVNMLFIGASNELGEFESGLTAHWFGTVPAVVLGGLGTLVVIAIWAWRFPELRRADEITAARANLVS